LIRRRSTQADGISSVPSIPLSHSLQPNKTSISPITMEHKPNHFWSRIVMARRWDCHSLYNISLSSNMLASSTLITKKTTSKPTFPKSITVFVRLLVTLTLLLSGQTDWPTLNCLGKISIQDSSHYSLMLSTFRLSTCSSLKQEKTHSSRPKWRCSNQRQRQMSRKLKRLDHRLAFWLLSQWRILLRLEVEVQVFQRA